MVNNKMVWHGLNYGKGEQNIHVETNIEQAQIDTGADILKNQIADAMKNNAPEDAGVCNVRTAWYSYKNYELDIDRMTASVNFYANRDLEDAEYEKMAQAVFETVEKQREQTTWKSMSTDYGVYVETALEINLDADEVQKEALERNGYLDTMKRMAYDLPDRVGVQKSDARFTTSFNREGRETIGLFMDIRTMTDLSHDEKQNMANWAMDEAAEIMDNEFSAAVNSILTNEGSLEK